MYLGKFYFDTKELFLLLGIALLLLSIFFKWDLWRFDQKTLLTLAIVMLLLKGLLPSIHNEAFFMHAVVTVLLTLFLPMFQVLLFYFITFFIFRVMKII